MANIKVPKTIGAAIDALWKLREQRKELDSQSTKLKSSEKILEDGILAKFTKQDLDGSRGKLAQLTVSPLTVPVAEDWSKIYAHIKKTGAFELLHKRLSSEAMKERWDANKKVPGVGRFNIIRLSLTVVKSRR